MKIVIAGAAANILSAHRRGFDAVDARVVAVQDINAQRAQEVAEECLSPGLAVVRVVRDAFFSRWTKATDAGETGVPERRERDKAPAAEELRDVYQPD